MALKFYPSVAKGLKLKIRKLCELIPTFVEVTGEKLVRGPLLATINIREKTKEKKARSMGKVLAETEESVMFIRYSLF